MSDKKLRVLDLFCGAGGLSWGFEKIGFEVCWGLDDWKPAVSTFKANHPKAKVYEVDITKVSNSQLKEWFKDVHIIVGGPPCQGFSTAGKRALDDPRNKLVKEFLRVVKVLMPDAFVMENVEGFMNFNKGALVLELMEELEKFNYNLTYGVLDAVNYGVPQRRKRFFLIGIKCGKPKLPEPSHSGNDKNGNLLLEWLKPPLTFKDATSDLPLIEAGEKAEEYASPPKNEYQKRMRNGSSNLTLHEAPNHKIYMVELIKYIPQGKSAFEVMDEIPKELRPTSGYPNSYKRIKPDEPAPTITRNFTTPSSANCIHPFAHRALTLREGARIQSFPDSYEFVGSFTDKRLLIGNAVPLLLSLAVAKSIAKSLGIKVIQNG
jgi:DNA (cytosine-5)-methyltransferase 1